MILHLAPERRVPVRDTLVVGYDYFSGSALVMVPGGKEMTVDQLMRSEWDLGSGKDWFTQDDLVEIEEAVVELHDLHKTIERSSSGNAI